MLEEHSEKPPSEPDDSLLLTSDSLPIFLEEPQNSYVVKNRPTTLRCRAAHALRLYFKCNGAKNVDNLQSEFVDPHTGVRIVEVEANITRDMVEEFFGKEKFKCECYAWSGRGDIKSQPAFVEVACEYLLLVDALVYYIRLIEPARGGRHAETVVEFERRYFVNAWIRGIRSSSGWRCFEIVKA